MVIDDGGAIWLSNPWLVMAVLSFAVGLVLWCHRWLETGSAPAPRTLSTRAFCMAERRADSRAATEPAQLRPALRTRTSTLGARLTAPGTLPRSAA